MPLTKQILVSGPTIPILNSGSITSTRQLRIIRLIKLVVINRSNKQWTMEPKKLRILGQVVRKRRDNLGMNQRDLAKRAMLSQPTVCRLEHGKSVPKFGTMVMIARGLGTTVSNLYHEAWGSDAP